MIGEAIDEVAAAASEGAASGAGMTDLTARLARIWVMLAELDPALARRWRGYTVDDELAARPSGSPPAATGPPHPLGARPGSGADDLDVECGADLGMQADRDLVRADGLDRGAYLDPALVQARAACGADRVGDVRRPH
jgi:hypothetical protein